MGDLKSDTMTRSTIDNLCKIEWKRHKVIKKK